MAKAIQMPPAGVHTGSTSKSVQTIDKSAKNWRSGGERSADAALSNDKTNVRKPVDPKSVTGPKSL